MRHARTHVDRTRSLPDVSSAKQQQDAAVQQYNCQNRRHCNLLDRRDLRSCSSDEGNRCGAKRL